MDAGANVPFYPVIFKWQYHIEISVDQTEQTSTGGKFVGNDIFIGKRFTTLVDNGIAIFGEQGNPIPFRLTSYLASTDVDIAILITNSIILQLVNSMVECNLKLT